MKKILLVVLTTSFYVSCSNENITQDSQPSILSYLTNKTAENHFTISASSINGNVASVDITKDFKDNNVKKFYSRRPRFKAKKSYNGITNHVSSMDENINEATSIFGSNIPLYNKNNSKYLARAYEEVMYVPERISIENPEGLKKLSTNKDLSIAWNPDKKNPIDKISIVIVNRGNISGRRIVNAEDYYIHKVVEDNGNFKISKEDLKKFGSNVHLDIAISRGNQVTKNNVVHTAVTTDLVPVRTINRDNIMY